MAGARVITGTHFSRHYRHRDDTVILFTVPIGRRDQIAAETKGRRRTERKRELTREILRISSFTHTTADKPEGRRSI